MLGLLKLITHLLFALLKLCQPGGVKAVMAVIDQFSRRIVGFSIKARAPSRTDICRMFNSVIKGQPRLPKYLSSDNDPLFKFQRWQANLRILEIDEIKSVPYTPESHPFIERFFRSVRNEFIDHTLFWNSQDLQTNLNQYKSYYNSTRGHWSLDHLTPNQQAECDSAPAKAGTMGSLRWQSHCSGLLNTPIAV